MTANIKDKQTSLNVWTVLPRMGNSFLTLIYVKKLFKPRVAFKITVKKGYI